MYSFGRYAVATLVLTTFSATVASAQSLRKLPNDDASVTHALQRLTFGPRPGDVEKVRQMGLDRWFDQQLNPTSIPDTDADGQVAKLLTLHMSPVEMAMKFPSPQELKQMENGNLARPAMDADEKAIYQTALHRYEKRLAAKGKEQDGAMMAPGDDTPETHREAVQQAEQLMAKTPDSRYQAILAMPDEDRVRTLRALTPEQKLDLVSQLTPKQRETVVALTLGPAALVTTELYEGKLLREIYSERQLQEVMTDFWLNHFNIFINKGQERYMLADYERNAIRPHALGKFKDLLLATAHSPAMMFYLDNAESVGPDSQFVRRAQFRRAFNANANAKQRLSGLNENYAREVMELHTMGVDGGYTQQDVTELARILTGWSIRGPRQGGPTFEFREQFHQPGDKHLLGRKFSDHGEREGIDALEFLAKQPATARFISKKLAMRFVSDNPPQTLVDRMAKTFQSTDGDIREVLRTMVHSPEFWSQQTDATKFKTPLEFVVSSVRSTGADVANAQALAVSLARMGMPLYGMQPPTGYSMKQEAWVNSAALLARFNFSLALATNRIPGVRVNPERLTGDGEDPTAALEHVVLHGSTAPTTHQAILRELNNPTLAETASKANLEATETSQAQEESMAIKPKKNGQNNALFLRATTPPTKTALALGLILGSPEFQRR